MKILTFAFMKLACIIIMAVYLGLLHSTNGFWLRKSKGGNAFSKTFTVMDTSSSRNKFKPVFPFLDSRKKEPLQIGVSVNLPLSAFTFDRGQRWPTSKKLSRGNGGLFSFTSFANQNYVYRNNGKVELPGTTIQFMVDTVYHQDHTCVAVYFRSVRHHF